MHTDSEAQYPHGGPPHRFPGRALIGASLPVILALIGLAALTGTAAAQATSTATPAATATIAATATPTTAAATATPAPATATPTPLVVTATPTSTSVGPTATPVPGLTLSPQQGPPNTSVGGTGTNFAPGDTVQLLFNGAQVDSKQADTTGLVNFQFSVPTLANGQYPVLATGQSRGSASVNFTISGTSVTLSSQQGPPGTSVTATGTGFQAGETVTVNFNGAQVGTPVADTTGTVTVTFTIPQLAAGNYQVDTRGQTSGDTASATFTVGGASVALSAASGPVGASLTANGSGFVPGDTVRLVFAGSPINTQNADTNGNVSFNFAIPNVAVGNYFVVLSGQSGATASAAFAVTSSGAATPVPTATPAASVTPQPAPPIPHDDRYYALTGYRIDNDQVNAFFQCTGAVRRPSVTRPRARSISWDVRCSSSSARSSRCARTRARR